MEGNQMNRRVFESTYCAMKATLLEAAAKACEDNGLTFDRAQYEAQASFEIGDVCREMLFFGANAFPVAAVAPVLEPVEFAA